MIDYDKIPFPTEKISRIKAMLATDDFFQLERCLAAALHSKEIDAINLRNLSNTKAGEYSKRLAQSEVLLKEASELSDVIHLIDKLKSDFEFFTLKIKE